MHEYLDLLATFAQDEGLRAAALAALLERVDYLRDQQTTAAA
jgi:hypothetical protein